MAFPLHRYRRLRLTESLRAMVRETTLDPADFIAPMFVVPGEGVRQPIPSMPGIEGIGWRIPSPGTTNIGAMKSAGSRVVSRTIARSDSVRRRRR